MYRPYPLQQRLDALAQHIRELHMRDHHWTNDKLVRLLPHIPLLNLLTLYNSTDITDTGFKHLPQYCQQLTSVKLFFANLTHVSFTALARHCPQLCDLSWQLSEYQSPEWLAMFSSCPLKRLYIYPHDLPINEKAITIIKTFDQLTCLGIFFAKPALMKSLLLPPTTTTTSSSGNSDQHHHDTTHYWPQLTELTLNNCDDIDDTTLITFIKSHRHLQGLGLHGAERLTDTSLDAMAQWLPNLTRLTLIHSKITSSGIRRLVCGCRRLECIQIKDCHRILRRYFWVVWERQDGHTLDQQSIDKIRQDGNNYNDDDNNN